MLRKTRNDDDDVTLCKWIQNRNLFEAHEKCVSSVYLLIYNIIILG